MENSTDDAKLIKSFLDFVLKGFKVYCQAQKGLEYQRMTQILDNGGAKFGKHELVNLFNQVEDNNCSRRSLFISYLRNQGQQNIMISNNIKETNKLVSIRYIKLYLEQLERFCVQLLTVQDINKYKPFSGSKSKEKQSNNQKNWPIIIQRAIDNKQNVKNLKNDKKSFQKYIKAYQNYNNLSTENVITLIQSLQLRYVQDPLLAEAYKVKAIEEFQRINMKQEDNVTKTHQY